MGCGASQEEIKQPPRNLDVPPPSPPSTRKEDIFKKEDYAYVDQHVAKMPPKLFLGNFEALIAYLTSKKGWNDVAKIRAIFAWIASVDIYRLPVLLLPDDDSPLACFYKIRSNISSYQYDDLLEHMCRLASIPCVKLQGKKRASDERFGFGKWNAVYIAGSWRFIDLHWACISIVGQNTGEWVELESDGKRVNGKGANISLGSVVHNVNEYFFLTDPDKLIWDHYPNQTEWQLLKTPVTQKQFEDHYYIQDMFYDLELTNTPATKLNYIVETRNGETDFTFGLPENRSFTYNFTYKFYRARTLQKDKELNAVLDRFVMFEHREDLLRFSLRFPITGKFKLEIYGKRKNEIRLDLCCSYVINCSKAKEGCLPLPDCPPLGWGPNPATKAAGLKPLTHKEAKVVTKDGYIEIRLSKEKALAFHQMLKHHHLDDATLSKYSVTELDGDEAVVYLRLPQKGEYALKLFAQGLDDKGTAPNVLNYLISCNQAGTHSERFPNVTTGVLGRNETNSKEFGVKVLSHSGGNLNTKDGKLSLDFELTSNMTELVCEMHTNDSAAAKRMSSSITNDRNKWKFDLDMPVKGEYSLNVFARRKDDPAQVFHIHTYLIHSSGRGDGSKAGSKAKAVDMSVSTKTLETSDPEMMVLVPPDVSRATAAIHKRTGTEAPDPSKIKFLSTNDRNQFKVKLTDFGEYMVNVYSVDSTGKLLKNVARYQINRKLPSELNQKGFQEMLKELKESGETTLEKTSAMTDKNPKKLLKRDLLRAMKSNNPPMLEQAIAKYLDFGGDKSAPLIKKAKYQLEICKARAALRQACEQRSTKTLDEAINRAKKVNMKQELDEDIDKAVALRDHLVNMRKWRHAVLDLEGKTISELKSYSKPPDGVHQCLMATFLLLGHHHYEVKEWHQIQTLLGKTGQESLMRKVSKFDSETVSKNTAMTAKKTLSPFSKKQIRDVSAGAATFYIWALGVINDVSNRIKNTTNRTTSSRTRKGSRLSLKNKKKK